MFCEYQMIWYVKKCSVTHFAAFQITVRILRGWVCIWWRDLTKKRLISSLEWRVEVQKLMVGWGLQPKRKKATQSRKEWFFSLFSKINFICLFVCFWLCWTFIVARRLSLAVEWGLMSACGAHASRCSGFSCGAQAPGAWASVVAAWGL